MTRSSPRHEFDYVEKKSCFRAQCNCFCGTGSCRFCCRGCPPMKESTLTRMIYIAFLMLGIFIMALFMSNEIQDSVMKFFRNEAALCEWLGADSSCYARKLMGYLAVYRIGLAIALYHLILMIFTCGVKSSKDCRAGLHNGFWLYKVMLLAVLLFCVFLIPDRNDYFITAWMYVAMTGGAAFIVIQLVLLVFLVHKWTDKIQERVNNGGSRVLWYACFGPGFATLLFLLSLAGVVLLYFYFASDEGCYKNQWFIFINAGCCVIVSAVAGFRKDSKPFGLRLLHASLITLYVTYLTWIAISSAPRRYQKYGRGYSMPSVRGTFRGGRLSANFDQEYYCGPYGDEETLADNILPYVSFVVTVVTVVYGSLGISERENCRALELPQCPNETHDRFENHPTWDPEDMEDMGGQIVIRNERRGLFYSYTLFHAMMTLSCLLMMMHLTQWHNPTRANLVNFGRSWPSVWIKISSSWVCLAIYFITVLFPSVLPSVLPSPKVKPSFMPVVEMNGHAMESDDDQSHISEEAVPLTKIRRPTVIASHQETTV